MIELLTEPGVAVSVAVALAFLAASRSLGPRQPSAWVGVAAAVGLGLVVARPDLGRYTEIEASMEWWIGLVVMGAGLALFIGGVLRTPTQSSGPTMAGVFVGIASVGVFLCVPETDLLRLLPGPIVVVAVGAAAGWSRPLGTPALVAIGSALTWISLTDGLSRGSAIIGAAGCLAVLAILPAAIPSDVRTAREVVTTGRIVPVTVPIVAIVLISRVAGVRSSTTVSVLICLVVLAAGWAGLRSLTRNQLSSTRV